MSRYLCALLNERWLRWVTSGLLALSIVTNGVAFFVLYQYRQDPPPLFIPPDIRFGDTAQTLKIGAIPEAMIWHFAGEIFQGLNTWLTNGEDDYPQQIYRYHALLTPPYRRYLEKDWQRRTASQELDDRVRVLLPVPGRLFAPEMVREVAPGVWAVWMDTVVKEWRNGTAVKDRYVRFHLRVVRWPLSRDYNPWGLALHLPLHPPEPLDADTLALADGAPG